MKRATLFLALSGLLAVAGLLPPAATAGADPPVRIVVWKAQRQIWLMHGDRVVRRYPVSLGRDPVGPKEGFGDMKTPVGTYFIYEKRAKTKYHRFLAINYPELADAERAFRSGVISATTWADIWYASKRREKPPWDTPLGGFVGIHGTGAAGRRARLRHVLDWTEGCIALSDRHIEELYDLVPVGTTVEIHEKIAEEPRVVPAAVPIIGGGG
ncbi:MAG: L,D-transpeptidase family protein [Candidatus Binatia bacterium]